MSAEMASNSQPHRPDVLVIMCDQFNPRLLGYAGDQVVRTPNLDALAAEGMAFSAAYTTSPVCMPARCSFASGRYPHNHRIWGNFTGYRFPAEEISLFRAVRATDYSTAQIGKFHYHLPEWGEGFDDYRDYYAAMGLDFAQELPEPYHAPFFRSDYSVHLQRRGLWEPFLGDIARRFQSGNHSVAPSPLPPDDHADSFVAQQAITYIERCPRDQPMFLFVSFPGPHPPLDAPGEYATMFDPEKMVLAPNVGEDIARQGKRFHDRRELQEMQANYYGKIALIDTWIGRLFDALRRRGTWNDAAVFFTADHGEYLGSHGRLGKGGFEEESGRVPLVIRCPTLGATKASNASSAVVGHLDVYQTILDLVGAERPAATFGQSLLPLLAGQVDTVTDAVFAEIGHAGSQEYMVRTDRYKWFIRAGRESLFDLYNDPYELTDLASSPAHQPLLHELRDRLRRHLMQTQVVLSADYKSLFTRAGSAVGNEDIASRMLALFHRLHG